MWASTQGKKTRADSRLPRGELSGQTSDSLVKTYYLPMQGTDESQMTPEAGATSGVTAALEGNIIEKPEKALRGNRNGMCGQMSRCKGHMSSGMSLSRVTLRYSSQWLVCSL